jgi:hypothetical protein
MEVERRLVATHRSSRRWLMNRAFDWTVVVMLGWVLLPIGLAVVLGITEPT